MHALTWRMMWGGGRGGGGGVMHMPYDTRVMHACHA